MMTWVIVCAIGSAGAAAVFGLALAASRVRVRDVAPEEPIPWLRCRVCDAPVPSGDVCAKCNEPVDTGRIDALQGPLSSAEVNALPRRVREYVYALETRCDPAGDTQRLAFLEHENAGLRKMLGELKRPRCCVTDDCEKEATGQGRRASGVIVPACADHQQPAPEGSGQPDPGGLT